MAEVLARRCDDATSQKQQQQSDSTPLSKFTAAATHPKSASNVTAAVLGKTRIPTSKSMATTGLKSLRSPRCEAFMMTGDKMLILNPKISQNYAKMHQEQLLPSEELYDGEENCRENRPFDDFHYTDHVVSGRRRTSGATSTSNSHSDHNTTSQSEEASAEIDVSSPAPASTTNGDAETTPCEGPPNHESAEFHDDPPDISSVTSDASQASNDSRVPDSMAKRLIGPSKSATSTPMKRQSGSTVAADDGSSPALSVGLAVSSSAATSQYGSMTGGGGGVTTLNTSGAKSRRMLRDESSVSDVTTTLSMSMPRAETVAQIATQLFTVEAGYTLTDVAGFLARRDCELSHRIAAEFMSFFNFSGKRLDVALREFLAHVSLTGETSERAHILSHFSARYFNCNPTLFHKGDEVHTLVCALILLNTDLHGTNVVKKMTMREFVDNLLHTQYDYDRNMLKILYNAIKETPFQRVAGGSSGAETSVNSAATHRPSVDREPSVAIAEKSLTQPPPHPFNDPMETPRHRRGVSVATTVATVSVTSPTTVAEPLSRRNTDRSKQRRRTNASLREQQDMSLFVNPREQVDYKRGWLLKKSVYDADGRRTPFGRRRWQMCYATLRGMVLYLHKNEKVFERSRHETFANCVRLHHAMAEVARDYKKRQHVFCLRTANLGEILFETSESTEVQRWIDAINYVSAAFSTPPLPVAISSAESATGAPPAAFFRFPPALPTTPTTLSMGEQLRAHCERLDEVTEALAKLRAQAPSIKTKGRAVYEYFYRERYLDKERERYTIYVSILSEKLGATSLVDVSSVASSGVPAKKHSNATTAASRPNGQ